MRKTSVRPKHINNIIVVKPTDDWVGNWKPFVRDVLQTHRVVFNYCCFFFFFFLRINTGEKCDKILHLRIPSRIGSRYRTNLNGETDRCFGRVCWRRWNVFGEGRMKYHYQSPSATVVVVKKPGTVGLCRFRSAILSRARAAGDRRSENARFSISYGRNVPIRHRSCLRDESTCRRNTASAKHVKHRTIEKLNVPYP
jgi:hypothetical protein